MAGWLFFRFKYYFNYIDSQSSVWFVECLNVLLVRIWNLTLLKNRVLSRTDHAHQQFLSNEWPQRKRCFFFKPFCFSSFRSFLILISFHFFSTLILFLAGFHYSSHCVWVCVLCFVMSIISMDTYLYCVWLRYWRAWKKNFARFDSISTFMGSCACPLPI